MNFIWAESYCCGVGWGGWLFFIFYLFIFWCLCVYVFEEVSDGIVVDQKMRNWELSLKGVLNSMWMQVGGSKGFEVLEV